MEDLDDPAGVPLSTAVIHFAPPELLAAYEAARERARGKRRAGSFWMGGEPLVGWEAANRMHRDNYLVSARDQAWRAIYIEFKRRLLAGELVATALVEPLGLTGRREVIPPDRWRFLKLLQNDRAEGKGLRLFDVRVRPAGLIDQTTVQPPITVQAGPAPRNYTPPKLRAEMKHRARTGQLTWNWGADSKALFDWIKVSFDHGRLPKDANNIRRTYRELYRELEREFRSGDQGGDKMKSP
jgi:hypothetical protein